MQALSLTTLADEQLAAARQAHSGRSAHTVYGGREHALRQTLLAIAGGHGLDEHASPGEASLQVLRGHVRIDAGPGSCDVRAGEYAILPPDRHSVAAVEDSVVLLTVVTGSRG